MLDVRELRAHLIFVGDARARGVASHELARAARRGSLVRVRRGVYLPTPIWEILDGRMRHILAVLAVVQQARSPFLVAGRSAGALWGLPFAAEWPDDVTTLVPMASGGKSEPGVKRTMAAAGTAEHAEVDGIPVTTLARTALDMARGEDFPRAVAILDRALWWRSSHMLHRAELDLERARAGYARRDAHLSRVIDFASHLSDSPYESVCRAMIHELGFAAPELQVEFRDDEGIMRPDFTWHGIAVAEFDGKVKYTRDEYTRGDPGEVLWREKRREDRLRRLVPRVVRIVAEDLRDPARVARLLIDAGVPSA